MLQINLIHKTRITYLQSYKHYEIFYYNCTVHMFRFRIRIMKYYIIGKPIKDVKYDMMVTKFGRIPERQQ